MAAMNKAQAQRYRQQQQLKRMTSYGAEPGEITRGLRPGDRWYDPDTNTWQLKAGRGIPGGVGVDDNDLVEPDSDADDLVTLDALRGHTLPVPGAAKPATVSGVTPAVSQPVAATVVDDMLKQEGTPSVQGSEGRTTGEQESTRGSGEGGEGTSGAGTESSGRTSEGRSSSESSGSQGWSDTEPPGGSSEDVKNDPDVKAARAEGWDWTPWLVGGVLTLGAIKGAQSFMRNRKNKTSIPTQGGGATTDSSGPAKPAADTAGEADRGGTGEVESSTIKPASDMPEGMAEKMAAQGMIPPTETMTAATAPDTRALAAATAGVETPAQTATRVAQNVQRSTQPVEAGRREIGGRSVADLVDPGGVARAGYYTGDVPPWDESLGDFQDTRISEGPTVDAAAALSDKIAAAEAARSPTDESIDLTIAGPDEVKPDLGPVIGPAVTEPTKPKGLTTYGPSAERQADDAEIAAARAKLTTNELPQPKSIRQILADIIMGRNLPEPTIRENQNLPPELREALRRRRAQTGSGVAANAGPAPIRGNQLGVQDIVNQLYGGGEMAVGPGPSGAQGDVPLTPADIASQIQSGQEIQMTTPPTDPLGGTQGQQIRADAELLVQKGVRSPDELDDLNTQWGKMFKDALPDVKNLYKLAIKEALKVGI